MDSTRISRYLSLILRHKPEAAGITLDEHGWADVFALIRGVAKKYPWFGWVQLLEIVETDNKQRYSFNEDMTKIRANQGHSVNVDVELVEMEPPMTLYHGTATKYEDSIDKDGLIPKSRLYVHLSKDIETALNVGKRHGAPVIYTVESRLMHRCGYKFYLSENGVWLTKEVPVRFMNKVDMRCVKED